MSHSNILKLAKKFSVKLAEEANVPIQETFEKFKSNLRAILNEMDGDILTLRVKGADRNLLKELSNLQVNLREKFKSLDESRPVEAMESFILYIFSKQMKISLINLHAAIQKFLKENEVDFAPHSALSQVRAESVTNLLRFAYLTRNSLANLPRQKQIDPNSELLKSEKEQYQHMPAGAGDVTKVRK